MDNIYTKTLPSRTLSQYSTFWPNTSTIRMPTRLVYSAFMSFFTRNIVAYDYHNEPVCFVGSTCMTYSDILRQAAADFGITIAKNHTLLNAWAGRIPRLRQRLNIHKPIPLKTRGG